MGRARGPSTRPIKRATRRTLQHQRRVTIIIIITISVTIMMYLYYYCSDTLGLLPLNDRKSRHRRIKKQRRYERLAATSQLSLW